MNWSSTKPTCVGWYWYREHGHATIVMVVIDPMYINHPLRAVFQEPLPAGDCLPVAELDGEWAGPIEEPLRGGELDIAEDRKAANARCEHGQLLSDPCEGCTEELARKMNEEALRTAGLALSPESLARQNAIDQQATAAYMLKQGKAQADRQFP